ncbi:MAG: T9SS type A sorting domain-containing protein [Bacteroidales bacterium]|jgi:hypothetical protein
MKTKFTLKIIFIICILYNVANAQTYTSVANGSWLNPLIWSPTPPAPFFVPILGVNATAVIINTNVTVDTVFTYTTGTLTINKGKSLSEGTKPRGFLVNGGTFTNNGTFNFNSFGSQAGTATNHGVMNINFVFYNNINFLNDSNILGVDSFQNDKVITNTNKAHIVASKFLNNKTIVNNGVIDATDFLNADSLYNNGRLNFTNFTNSQKCINDSLIIFNDFINFGNFENNDEIQGNRDFLNWGFFNNKNYNSFVSIARNFLNVDSTLHKAVFNNDGYVHIAHDWLNIDTVKGTTGQFQIGDSTANLGYMKGSFDFCDSTPPPSSPYIDFNSGTIDPGITYCLNVKTADYSISKQIKIYPNPVNDFLRIENGGNELRLIEVYDLLGNIALQSNYKNIIDVSQLPDGIYLINIIDVKYNSVKSKLVVEH